MKFGFFSPYLDTFGGGERYMLTLASHFAKNNVVDIFWDQPKIKPLLARFLKIDLNKTHFVKNIFSEKSFNKAKKTFGYNCIFILSDGSVPFTFAKRSILHFQVPFTFEKPNLKTKLKLKRYKYIICNSFFTKSFVDKSFLVSSKVIYPPVDVVSIKPSKKEKIILSVGRFGPNQLHPKKQEVLIEVFKELSKRAPGWKLVLAGQAKKTDEKYLNSLKKDSRGFAIRIVENMPVEKLRKLYSQSSIYWHATGFGEDENKNPEKMEHFGISTVEASAGGAVPVVIGLGGQKEIVKNGVNGLLWTTKAQLFESTLNLINNPEKLHRLSKQAVKNSKRFGQDVFFKEYEKILL
jgi:glycosyltransferase involved in cell wall biosynthesis